MPVAYSWKWILETFLNLPGLEDPAGFAFVVEPCLLYTSDAADERSSVDLGGRRIIKKKNIRDTTIL